MYLTTFHIMVNDEYERTKKMLLAYRKELKNYPDGNIVMESGSAFLTDGDQKIKIKSEDVKMLQNRIQLREKCRETILKLETEKQEIEYMLGYPEWRKQTD